MPGVRVSGWWQLFARLDPESQAHRRRVAALAVAFARHLGSRTRRFGGSGRAPLLHDIGKLAVPPDILRKPGPLTEGEFRIMRMHPTYAFQIMWPVAEPLRLDRRLVLLITSSGTALGTRKGCAPRIFPGPHAFWRSSMWRTRWRRTGPIGRSRGRKRFARSSRRRAGSHFDPLLARLFLQSAIAARRR